MLELYLNGVGIFSFMSLFFLFICCMVMATEKKLSRNDPILGYAKLFLIGIPASLFWPLAFVALFVAFWVGLWRMFFGVR